MDPIDSQKQILARLDALAAKAAAMQPPRLPRADRQAFLDIALLCKRALEQPPYSLLYRQYVLEIARVCKRWLERDA